MPDAFLDSDLVLDIRAALQQVDRLNEAVHRATTDVRVTVDARQVATAIQAAIAQADTTVEATADGARITSGITAAVDAADADLVVETDARRITAAIDGAVDAADSMVEIAADAGRVTGAIDAAVDQADTTVQVTGNVSSGLTDDVSTLDVGLAGAATSAGLLGGALAGLSVAAAAGGLFALADAASELEQSIGGTEAVFGEAEGAVSDFARTADSMAGLTETAARTLTSQIGGLLKGFGFTREEAAATSVQLAQLGADLAATFGGRPEEAVEALGGALRGEFNPLERFGVSLNVAQINAYALANGMAASEAEVTTSIRAQAALAVIMERTSDAQGQFNRELDTAGGAMSVARAEAGNLAAEAGTLLLPALVALVTAMQTEVFPALTDAAQTILPSLGDALVALTPLLGTTTDLLLVLAPVIRLVADTVALIPGPVLQMAGSLLAVNRALKLVDMARQSQLVIGFGKALSGLAVPSGTVAGAFNGLPAAAGGFRAGLRSLTTGVTGATAALGLGFTAVQMYGDIMAEARAEGEAWGQALRDSFDPATASLDELVAASADLDGKIADLRGSVDDSFLGRNTVNKDFNEALKAGIADAEAFQVEIDAMADAMRRADAEAEFSGLIGTLDLTGANMKALRDESVETFVVLNQMAGGRRDVERGFLDLSLAIQGAELSEEGMAAAAGLLGLEVEELEGIVNSVTEALDEFVSTATSALPTVGDAFAAALAANNDKAQEEADRLREQAQERADAIREGATAEAEAVEDSEVAQRIRDDGDERAEAVLEAADREATAIADGSVITARALTEALYTQTVTLQRFRTDLDAIREAGFADVAGLLAEQGIDEAGNLATELRTALEEGNVLLLENLSSANQAFVDEAQATSDYYRDVLGPELILNSGLIGEGAAEALFNGMDFRERIALKTALAASGLTADGQVIAAIAATEGADAAREFGAALDMDVKATNEAIAAGEAIKRNAPTVAAGEAGDSVGVAFADGFISGVRRKELEAALAAQGLTGAALIGARKLLGINSPSTAMIEVGEFFGEGFAIGIGASQRNVVHAADALAAAAVAASTRVPNVAVDLSGPGAGADGARSLTLADIDAVARVVAQAMPESLARDIVLHGVDLSDAGQSVSRELQSLANRM